MKPFYQDDWVTIYHGDGREIMPLFPHVDAVIADPPYGETRLKWDKWPDGWPSIAAAMSRQLWCFGTLRMFLKYKSEFSMWSLAQDVIWEKQNGSGLHNDRFRKVHEQIAHFYRGEWKSLFKQPVMVMDAQARSIRRQHKPAHWGQLQSVGKFDVPANGPRLERSVIYANNMHRAATNETQKPERVIQSLIRYSVPGGGLIMDPCGGSGTVARVAKDLGRRCVMAETREEQCEVAAKRMLQEQLSI